MSPSSSNTIVRPSGETSSESHVPSSVVNLSGVLGVSGSPAPRPPVESLPRPPRCACVGVVSAQSATAKSTGMVRRILASLLEKELETIRYEIRGGGGQARGRLTFEANESTIVPSKFPPTTPYKRISCTGRRRPV